MHDLARRRHPALGAAALFRVAQFRATRFGTVLGRSEAASPSRIAPLPGRRRPRPLLLLVGLCATALIVLGVTLLLDGGGPQPSVAGLPSAGWVTGWGLPAMRLLGDLAALGCVGALLVAGVLAPGGNGPLAGGCARAVSAASSWAAGWAAAAALTVLLTVSDVQGAPVGQVVDSGAARLAWALPQTRALLVVAVVAAVVSVATARVATTSGARWALGAALLGLTPPLYTGHSAHAADHALATGGLVVHVVAAMLWIGGLLGILLHLRQPGAVQLRAVRRFSTLALLCFCAVIGSGLLAALARLGTSLSTWMTAYGAVLAIKAVAAVGLAGFGWLHRRRTMAALRGGRPRAFWRLATGELVLMAVAMGLAVALSRTPAPTATGEGTLVLARVAGWWEPDLVATLLVLLALATYLNGVRIAGCVRFVQPRAASWPRSRTAAAVLAAVVALAALGAPLRPPTAVVVSVQVAQYLALAVVVPVLVALAAPAALYRAVRPPAGLLNQPGRLARSLRDPVNAFVLLVAVTAAAWATPLGSMATKSPLLHLALVLGTLAAGTALFRSVLEDDPHRGRRPGRDRAVLLLATAAFLGGFAVALATRTPVPGTTAAGAGVASVAQVLADQHRAALLIVLVAVALVGAAVAGLARTHQTRDQGKTTSVTA
ncbi:MAG TPA: bifunctional copper resistance protein CopD/cytochrome c oxidase assembly protein [Actinomycetales bacterium]|nr:bifunctional copper resistance protein CopD/cytochrome c oxidase assembly protein [Actinomycetales bacterium]